MFIAPCSSPLIAPSNLFQSYGVRPARRRNAVLAALSRARSASDRLVPARLM